MNTMLDNISAFGLGLLALIATAIRSFFQLKIMREALKGTRPSQRAAIIAALRGTGPRPSGSDGDDVRPRAPT